MSLNSGVRVYNLETMFLRHVVSKTCEDMQNFATRE